MQTAMRTDAATAATPATPAIHPPRTAHQGRTPDIFDAILRPEAEIAIWQRPADPAILAEVGQLGATALPSPRRLLTAVSGADDGDASTRGAAADILRECGLDPAGYASWIDDIALLVARFLRIAGKVADSHGVPSRPVTLRLETLSSDGCRRFHVDRCRLRLLCTYRGPGTEWLPSARADRAALAGGAGNDEILRGGEPSHLQPFWAAITKGERFPGNTVGGLIHRSPSIAGRGQTRVLVCIDA